LPASPGGLRPASPSVSIVRGLCPRRFPGGGAVGATGSSHVSKPIIRVGTSVSEPDGWKRDTTWSVGQVKNELCLRGMGETGNMRTRVALVHAAIRVYRFSR